MREDALAWCREDRSIAFRIPLFVYGVFLLWKISFRPQLFTPLDFLNLGFHEFGHIVFAPFGEWVGVAGGSMAQIVVPLYGVWQFLRQRDYFASAFSLAWLGESLGNLSVYIGDARKQELPLVNLFGGDPIHDWAYLLASLNRLNSDISFSLRVRSLGLLSVLVFLWIGAWLLWNMRQSHSEA